MKNRKKQDNATAQSAIYVGFVDTPGLFASIIRRVIGQNYVHVVLGFDPELKEAYSIGRRNPAIPLFAGFERENREKILKKYPTARYQICRVACTNVQREALQQETKTEWERRFTHHYMVIGLVFLLAGIAFDQKNHDTCSSWRDKRKRLLPFLQADLLGYTRQPRRTGVVIFLVKGESS